MTGLGPRCYCVPIVSAVRNVALGILPQYISLVLRCVIISICNTTADDAGKAPDCVVLLQAVGVPDANICIYQEEATEMHWVSLFHFNNPQDIY